MDKLQEPVTDIDQKIAANVSGRLRNRLFLLLLSPLLAVGIFFSIETHTNAHDIAKTSFDKSLTILTLAIIDQSENSLGDSLTEDTLDLINDTIGDVFFYHISAPEGGFITGYSNQPKREDTQPKIAFTHKNSIKPFLFDSTYNDEPVRAAFFRQYTTSDAYTGWVELTVWQYLTAQHELKNLLFTRSITRLSVFLLVTAIIVWFGIYYGLQPLAILQESITRRSINDLSAIKSAVPFEIKSLVESMNDLFYRLTKAMEKRTAFLGDASHQLKTPLARIQSQAELALRAKDNDAQLKHIKEVINLTRHSSRLTNQMLSLLRAESDDLLVTERRTLEINTLTKGIAEYHALAMVKSDREFTFEPYPEDLIISALPIMLTEAIGNLIENAMAYSIEKTPITIKIHQQNNFAEVWVVDGGPGIPSDFQEKAVHRFYRIPGTKANGCGLGLAIVNEIVKSFEGSLCFDGPEKHYFAIGIRIPLMSSLTPLDLDDELIEVPIM